MRLLTSCLTILNGPAGWIFLFNQYLYQSQQPIVCSLHSGSLGIADKHIEWRFSRSRLYKVCWIADRRHLQCFAVPHSQWGQFVRRRLLFPGCQILTLQQAVWSHSISQPVSIWQPGNGILRASISKSYPHSYRWQMIENSQKTFGGICLTEQLIRKLTFGGICLTEQLIINLLFYFYFFFLSFPPLS